MAMRWKFMEKNALCVFGGRNLMIVYYEFRTEALNKDIELSTEGYITKLSSNIYYQNLVRNTQLRSLIWLIVPIDGTPYKDSWIA